MQALAMTVHQAPDAEQVPELLVGVPAPVLYWEQGHEWLFGDPVRFQTVHNYLAQVWSFPSGLFWRKVSCCATVIDAGSSRTYPCLHM